jgi:pyruvate/2-oxoglutarate dehydrogenase complex dihydrolipoamide dehydrogenase (E3) component
MDAMGVDMTSVQRRKRLMVEGLRRSHVDRTAASGAELIMGKARFVGPGTVEINLNQLVAGVPTNNTHASA